MGKVIAVFFSLIVGAVLGLLVSYLFRPQTLFGAPDLQWWFTNGFQDASTAPTIAICGLVGLVIGLVVGLLLVRSRAKASDK